MDWVDALPDSLQQLLIGAAAEYAGLAGPAIYAAARTRLDARHTPQKQQTAVQTAIQRALPRRQIEIRPSSRSTGWSPP